MIKITVLLVAALLINSSLAQNCGKSVIPNLQTGIVQMGAPTQQLAQVSYVVPLTGMSLSAQMMSAFAIAGFQASTGQKFYSLVVDSVLFSNGNTIMTFNMDYTWAASGLTYTTTWTKIKLSYVVVSTSLITTGTIIKTPTASTLYGNYIYAGSVGINLAGDIAYNGIISATTFLQSATDIASAECGYMVNEGVVDLTCAGANAAKSRFLSHFYVMGFKYDPASTNVIAASVIRNPGANPSG